MRKIVYNACYGGFGLSDEAEELLKERTGKNLDEIERHDPELVKVVEELGDRVNDKFSKLAIWEIPDDETYIIREYDGYEYIVTRSEVDKWGWK